MVDFIVELAEVTDRPVAPAELFAATAELTDDAEDDSAQDDSAVRLRTERQEHMDPFEQYMNNAGADGGRADQPRRARL